MAVLLGGRRRAGLAHRPRRGTGRPAPGAVRPPASQAVRRPRVDLVRWTKRASTDGPLTSVAGTHAVAEPHSGRTLPIQRPSAQWSFLVSPSDSPDARLPHLWRVAHAVERPAPPATGALPVLVTHIHTVGAAAGGTMGELLPACACRRSGLLPAASRGGRCLRLAAARERVGRREASPRIRCAVTPSQLVVMVRLLPCCWAMRRS